MASRVRLSACMVLLVLIGSALTGSALTGCKPKSTTGDQAATKTYLVRGRITAVSVTRGSITIAHEKIPGFMDAMTMSYPLAEPETISELHPNDLITARLNAVDQPNGALKVTLDQIVVVAQGVPDTRPTVQYNIPKPGEVVPNFSLLDQSGKTIDLRQFRGKALLLTFIYTRCPLPDFCPRMSANFAEIDRALATDPKLYARTHLLSVSFDPRYDTPAVLRNYGASHTGKFAAEDFAHWEFAAPTLADLPKVEQFFAVGVTPGGDGDPANLNHSLSTVLIGPDGKIVAWYPTNDWRPSDALVLMRQAVAAGSPG